MRSAWTGRVRLGRVWGLASRRGACATGLLANRVIKTGQGTRTPQMSDTERASILAELTPPYALIRPPAQMAPVVLCSPHSGRVYPRAFLAASRLDPLTLRKSEDCYVDELFQSV